MKFGTKNIIIISILGIILLYSYYYFLMKNPNSQSLLWGKIKGNFLNVYYVSMLLSLIGFILLFHYLIINNSFTQNEVNKLLISLICIIVISMFWMPLSLYYLKNKNAITKYLDLLVLFLVALSTFYLLTVISNINDNKNIVSKKLAFFGMLYFFIHVFFFDFISWSYNFF
jgi:hypothetical protein